MNKGEGKCLIRHSKALKIDTFPSEKKFSCLYQKTTFCCMCLEFLDIIITYHPCIKYEAIWYCQARKISKLQCDQKSYVTYIFHKTQIQISVFELKKSLIENL